MMKYWQKLALDIKYHSSIETLTEKILGSGSADEDIKLVYEQTLRVGLGI